MGREKLWRVGSCFCRERTEKGGESSALGECRKNTLPKVVGEKEKEENTGDGTINLFPKTTYGKKGEHFNTTRIL